MQVSRLQDGSRKVTHITEVLGFELETQKYLLADLFVREYHGTDEHGRIRSELVPTGAMPSFLTKLAEHGRSLPAELMAEIDRRQAESGK